MVSLQENGILSRRYPEAKIEEGKIETPVKATPDDFKKFKETGIELGFRHVESGALVRSSYHADKHARALF